MKRQNEVPLSIIRKDHSTLIYFDIKKIKDINKVEKAYVLIESYKSDKYNNTINCALNNFLTKSQWENICSCYNKIIYCSYESHMKYIDITEIFHLLACDAIKNNGIILETNYDYLGYGKLCLTYKEDVLIPNCQESIFAENKLIISSSKGIAKSPWILTNLSKVISFYIKNISKYETTFYLQNSPNAIDFVDDAQKLTILSNGTKLLVPYAFSKYTRVVASSTHKSIIALIWFQTQLSR